MVQGDVLIPRLMDIARKEHGHVLDMSSASPQFPTDVEARQAGADADQNEYALERGSPEFNEVVLSWMEEKYLDLPGSFDAANLSATSGSKGMIARISLVLDNVRRKDGAEQRTVGLVPKSGYPTNTKAADYIGNPVARYDLTPEGVIDLGALSSRDLSGVSYLIVNSPHSPTGGLMTAGQYQELAELAESEGFWVISDESCHPFVWTKDKERHNQTMAIHGGTAPVVSAFSLSKEFDYASGRIGFLAGNKDIVEAMSVGAGALGGLITLASEATGMNLLSRYDELSEPIVARYESSLKLIIDSLGSLGMKIGVEFENLQMPDGGIHIWTRSLNPEEDGSALAVKLAESIGLVVSPGHVFGDDQETKSSIRVAGSSSHEDLGLLEERIAAL